MYMPTWKDAGAAVVNRVQYAYLHTGIHDFLYVSSSFG
jgi:hypothetical protein